MKGKRKFTEDEANKIRSLISQKLLASTKEQKKIREKIRDLGFYFSDFSNKKGYTVDDFDWLIESGQIRIIERTSQSINEVNEIMEHSPTKTRIDSNVSGEDIEQELFAERSFKQYDDLNLTTLDKTGFYCLRLKAKSKLPDRYQLILDKRKSKFLYIGKAEKQTLKKRLSQEICHKKPGTFFRSIGCVLGYLPIEGHLKGHLNQNNYKFSVSDTAKIVEWLISNIEISIVEYNGNFEIEKKFIEKYCPLLNDDHNPMKLQELKDDKDKCRKIARG
ncbi:hypothetical protein HQ47_01590 [Porphyromonas macacae]|uniref:GIY-YIG catalytic domain-containing protein n=1 Tax=Porphyromonas macacae TaxID=28115 RepID=A0A0A2EGV0_9PORP|nr:hypothetical protein [Porphyromonas macacae]KGN75654.1 hypothetical protein HQ47_01590 [Porphyromonas macacae]